MAVSRSFRIWGPGPGSPITRAQQPEAYARGQRRRWSTPSIFLGSGLHTPASQQPWARGRERRGWPSQHFGHHNPTCDVLHLGEQR